MQLYLNTACIHVAMELSQLHEESDTEPLSVPVQQQSTSGSLSVEVKQQSNSDSLSVEVQQQSSSDSLAPEVPQQSTAEPLPVSATRLDPDRILACVDIIGKEISKALKVNFHQIQACLPEPTGNLWQIIAKRQQNKTIAKSAALHFHGVVSKNEESILTRLTAGVSLVECIGDIYDAVVVTEKDGKFEGSLPLPNTVPVSDALLLEIWQFLFS
ncbi:hypothetical protein BDR26DRAFT_1005852 [Obelidium mucronatum]|nr:hypothetical protein BDR26DRAFT_1005852 [Obelidium mucronatum]